MRLRIAGERKRKIQVAESATPESESGLAVWKIARLVQSKKAMAENDHVVLYPGVLVSFRVPRQYESAVLDEAIAKIRFDIEKSIERHLPVGCVAELQKMA